MVFRYVLLPFANINAGILSYSVLRSILLVGGIVIASPDSSYALTGLRLESLVPEQPTLVHSLLMAAE